MKHPFRNSFYQSAPKEEQPRKTGPARYLEVFWDNLGKLLLGNLLTFAGFLPITMFVSLGLIYGNFWLTLLGGVLGGAIAGPFWTAFLTIAFHSFIRTPDQWFALWKHAFVRTLKGAACLGAVIGTVTAALLAVGNFAIALLSDGELPALPVWIFLAVDFFILAMAGTVLFSPLCFEQSVRIFSIAEALRLISSSPARMLGTGIATLCWCMFGISLFPVSIPFATLLGFWPLALLTAQLHGPVFAEDYSLEEIFTKQELEADPNRSSLSRSQRLEIWLRRFWAPALGIVVLISFALGVMQTMLNVREPDIQLAVVHADELPDDVVNALEASLASLVGDYDGDGTALAQINDYTVVFDGSAVNASVQMAGSTLLVTDLSASESWLYVVEDAESFLELYGDQVAGSEAKCWREYPVLAGLNAGIYSTLDDIETDRDGQELLAEYTVLPSLSCPEDILVLLLGEPAFD